jgi:hypothetical protein
MPDLVVLFGPPAAGKAAIGSALAEATGFRLFHNHMTAEAAAALFGWGTPLYGEAVAEIRLWLLSKALAEPSVPSIIFTYVWAFNLAADHRFMSQLVELVEFRGRQIYFVELLASLPARIAREGTPLRIALKPSKQDVARARGLHAELDGKYRMNSEQDFPYPSRHLIVDTESHPPVRAAHLVAEHFGFPLIGKAPGDPS